MMLIKLGSTIELSGHPVQVIRIANDGVTVRRKGGHCLKIDLKQAARAVTPKPA